MISPLWGPAYPTGSGIYAYELAKRMAEQGHEVHAFTSQIGNFNGMLLPKNLHLRVLRTYSMLWDMNPIANVLPILLREDFDVVHVHSYIFYMSNSTAAARLLKDFRYVLNFHGGISHSAIQDSCSRRLWIKDNVYDRTLGRATVALADKVLSVSKADIPLIRRAFGVDAQYIPNAVSIEDFKPGEKGAQRITYVGKLEKWKGVETLLEIFRQVRHEIRDAEFQIIGDGSLADKMRKADLPIIMRGHIPHENMPAQYRELCSLGIALVHGGGADHMYGITRLWSAMRRHPGGRYSRDSQRRPLWILGRAWRRQRICITYSGAHGERLPKT